MENKHRD